MLNTFKNKHSTCVFLIFIIFFGCNIYAQQDAAYNYLPGDTAIAKDRLFFETNEIESGDMIIRGHLMEKFPIISEDEINKIILSKSVTRTGSPNTDSLNSSASENTYKISFQVPVNYLDDTAKILWQLNIPGFESKIYQLYNGRQIYIDTWPNVIGKKSTKTYTGNFTAYKIRNWPWYKDPDPSKKDLAPTPPGLNNPLGLFVVHYDENSLRYFHGTNQNSLMQNKMRNLSHGCVRNDNSNIAKMKEFLIRRVVKSKDLTSWLSSKKTLIYDFEETDKFPVVVIYKTFEMDRDAFGKYIILYKDIYNYSNSVNIDSERDDPGLITLTNKDNLISEYNSVFGRDMTPEALSMIIEYLINNGKEYEKYYVAELKKKFMIEN